jgi:Helix-turn-helix
MKSTTATKEPISWPIPCPTCGNGEVVPVARPGRTARYKNMPALPVPEDLPIPTCLACGVEWIDRPTATTVDAALERQYQRRLWELAVAGLERLAALRITQQRVEKILGLSQGYLSKIRSGASRPSATLVSCLHLLASDPEHRLREMEEWFAAA